MQINYDRLHGRISWKPLPCRNLYPCPPADRLDARLLLLLTSTTHYIYDVMLDGGLIVSWAKAHGATKIGDNLGRSWHVSWVCGEGWVDQIGFYDESLMSLARGMRPGHSLREVHVAGTCVRSIIPRRWLFGMEVLSRHGVLVIPFEKMSCLVPLRTGISREPDHRTLCAHHSFLNGWGTDVD
jgi:hypothetical protein